MCAKNVNVILFFSVMVLLSPIGGLFGQFAGGSGTQADPWQIETAAHLNNLRNFTGSTHQNKHYIQIADLDLSEYDIGDGWLPIGQGNVFDPTYGFYGKYNGNGHTISNLYINRNYDSGHGLFGYMHRANISNLGLINVKVMGENHVGALAGYANLSVISNCYSTGTISGYAYVGGLVGTLMNSYLQNSYTKTQVNGRVNAGGLVGSNWESIIIRCFSKSNVYGIAYLGGIAGENQFMSEIRDCYSTGMVRGESGVGGLTGYDYYQPQIHRSFSVGHVSGGNNVGGLVGVSNPGTIINQSYWDIESSGQTQSPGGEGKTTAQMLNEDTFVDWDFAEIWALEEGFSYPYLQWQPDETMFNIPGPINLYALLDYPNAQLYWDEPINEPIGYFVYKNNERINETPITITEYYDEELTEGESYTYYITAVYDNNIESLPSIPIVFQIAVFAGGDGSVDNPFLIANSVHLNNVRYWLNSYFRQIADIELSENDWEDETGWVPIGESIANPFSGHYDGNDCFISGLRINRTAESSQGLFGVIDGAVIRNLRVSAYEITTRFESPGIHSTAAGIAGIANNQSIIEKCYSDGVISMEAMYMSSLSGLGGIAGYIDNSIVRQCISSGIITSGYLGNLSLGGLVGLATNGSNISNSYNMCSYEGDNAGGLIGRLSNSEVNNCFSIGKALSIYMNRGLIGRASSAVINSSYWDIEISGAASSAGGQGKTTVEMIQETTYSDWDFEEVWEIIDNLSYPKLRWQGEGLGYNIPAPRNLSYHYTNSSVELIWDQPVTAPIGYNVYRNNVQINDIMIENNFFVDDDFTYWIDYSYSVKAVYEGLIESLHSEPVNCYTVHFAGGTGTAVTPFLVRTPEQLDGVRYFPNYNFIQTADIDLNIYPWNQSAGWKPLSNQIGVTAFQGSYNGDGYIIENLYVNNENQSSQGLFGTIRGASIANLGVKNALVNGRNYVGSLVGNSIDSTISNCFASGNVSGNNYVGGLIGRNSGSYIEDSYFCSNGMVSGNENIGGFIGLNSDNSNVVRSFSAVYVIGTRVVGGFISSSSSSVVSSCYWDTEISQQATSAGGNGVMGRTTAQMTYPYASNTYSDWDFEDVWNSDEDYLFNSGYPLLRTTNYVGIEQEEVLTAYKLSMHNYPNPFNPDTNIVFTLPEKEKVMIEIFNIKGQRIKLFNADLFEKGQHRIHWNGKDDNGKNAASGVYLFKLSVGKELVRTKGLLMK